MCQALQKTQSVIGGSLGPDIIQERSTEPVIFQYGKRVEGGGGSTEDLKEGAASALRHPSHGRTSRNHHWWAIGREGASGECGEGALPMGLTDSFLILK